MALSQTKWLLALVLLFLCSQSLAAVVVPPLVTSSHPRLLVDSRLRSDWDEFIRLHGDSIEPQRDWYAFGERHTDDGSSWVQHYPYAYYQMTGDEQYAEYTWIMLEEAFLNQASFSSGNYARRNTADFMIAFDFIYDYLTPTRRATFLSKMEDLVDAITKESDSGVPVLRQADTDEVAGYYFGILIYYIVAGDESAHAAGIFDKAWIGGVTPDFDAEMWISGETKPSADSTVRSQIYSLAVNIAQGGSWPESTGYNPGTLSKLAVNYKAVKVAYGGVDYFPELATLFEQGVEHWMHLTAPGFVDFYQWGDEETSRDKAGSALSLVSCLVAATSSTSDYSAVLPYLNQILPAMTDVASRPSSMSYLVGGPFVYVEASPASQSLPSIDSGSFTPGQHTGLGTYRTGWSQSDSYLGVEFPMSNYIDHFCTYFGQFQFYRKGAWVLGTMLSYGPPTVTGITSNTARFFGWPLNYEIIREFKQVTAYGWTDNQAYFRGTSGGTHLFPGEWYGAPVWQHEYTRSILYIPSSDKSLDIVIIYDRANIQDPEVNPVYDNYRDHESASFVENERMEWGFHCESEPTLYNSGGAQAGASFTVPGDSVQHVRIDSSLVGTQRAVDENTFSGYIMSGDQKWRLEYNPLVDNTWENPFFVFQITDDGAHAATDFITTSNAAAVYIGSATAQLAIFNGQPGPDLHDVAPQNGQSYYNDLNQDILKTVSQFPSDVSISVPITHTSTSDLEIRVMDLDPSQGYTVDVAGVSGQLTQHPFEEAVLYATISNLASGSHTVNIYTGSTAPPSTPTPTPPTPTPTPTSAPTPTPTPTPTSAPTPTPMPSPTPSTVSADCVLSEWSEWTTCTEECGSGERSRSRTVLQEETGDGVCIDVLSQTDSCNPQACDVDCVVVEWGQWGACSASCGGGNQTRTRTVTTPATGAGTCPSLSESTQCNDTPCTGEVDVDCVVGEWGEWGVCDAECLGGVTLRTRVVVTPRSGNGAECLNLQESNVCNAEPCPSDCVLTLFTDWGPCYCTSLERSRYRDVVSAEANGGVSCSTYELEETQACPPSGCLDASQSSSKASLSASPHTLLLSLSVLVSSLLYGCCLYM